MELRKGKTPEAKPRSNESTFNQTRNYDQQGNTRGGRDGDVLSLLFLPSVIAHSRQPLLVNPNNVKKNFAFSQRQPPSDVVSTLFLAPHSLSRSRSGRQSYRLIILFIVFTLFTPAISQRNTNTKNEESKKKKTQRATVKKKLEAPAI
jgi:hypothetical protein